MRGEDEAERSNSVGALVARVRRYWWLVLAVTLVGLLGGVAATSAQPTTYVGRTSLIVSSNDRSPDQDAVIVQGYVDYFNNTAYQQQLLQTAGIHEDVTLSATDSASSPVLVISATTTDPKTAQSDAIWVAQAFMDDINDVHTTKNADRLAQLKQKLTEALASNNPQAQAVASDLQGQIDQIQSDQVNVLQRLQSRGGVAEQSPSLLGNVVPATLGGLLLGLLAAVLLSRLSRRIHGRIDVADKLELPTLVELPRARSHAARARHERRLGQLANIVRTRLSGPGVVAVAEPEEGYASSVVARELAVEWARQGYPTVLVLAQPLVPVQGTDGVLDATGPTTPQVRSGGIPGLSILQLAPPSSDDGPALAISKVAELLRNEALAGQYVVVDAPGLVRSAAAQAICHAADRTVLVVDTKITRLPPTREAVAVLRQMGARLMGVVVATVRPGEAQDVIPVPVAGGTAGAPSQRPAVKPAVTAAANGRPLDAGS